MSRSKVIQNRERYSRVPRLSDKERYSRVPRLSHTRYLAKGTKGKWRYASRTTISIFGYVGGIQI